MGQALNEEATVGSKLVAALARARKNFKPVKKDAENPFYNSKYADLSGYIDATADALAAEGLVVVQGFKIISHGDLGPLVAINTRIFHDSGETIDCGEYPIVVSHSRRKKGAEEEDAGPMRPYTAQEYGSAATYASRYSYRAALNLGAEDDDGEAASKGRQTESARDPKLVALDGEIHAAANALAKRLGGNAKAPDLIVSHSAFEIEKDGKVIRKSFRDPARETSEKWLNATLSKLRDRLANMDEDVVEGAEVFK